MSWPRVLAARLRGLIARNRLDRELHDEVLFHLEMQAEDNRRAGMNSADARRSALRSFGRVEHMKEHYREWRGFSIIETIGQDLRYALRTMRRNPGFCVTAIFTLALGIGANTAIFTLLYGLILRSLPVSQPSRLATVEIAVPGMGAEWSLEWGMYQQILHQQRSFTEMSAWSPGNRLTMPDRDGTLRFYSVSLVSGGGFHVLGVKPWLGRLLEAADDVRGGPPRGWSVVLSYDFWNERFGGDPATIGKSIRVADTFMTVVGVAPAGFHGVAPGLNPKLYLPFQIHSFLDRNSRDLDYGCNAIARLKPGASFDQANAELKVYQNDMFSHFLPTRLTGSPGFKGAYLHASSARAGLRWFTKDYRQPLLLMQALVGVVLLLCCVNVGGLMMSKSYSRRHEFALRKAIGGARWRLIRQYLLESSLIAVAGGALGAVGAWFGTSILASFFSRPDASEQLNIHPDMTMLLVTGGLALCATILFGILPAWQAGRSDPGDLLKSRTAAGGRTQFAGRLFVPLQVAISLVLVTVAALLSQSMIRLRGQNPGFDAPRVTVQSAPFYHQLPQKDDDSFLDVYQRMVDRLEELPGVQSAAITGNLPTAHDNVTSRFAAAGGARETPMAYNHVGPGYFRTMRSRILAGREFRRGERDRGVCMVNESAAQYLYPNGQAIGQPVMSMIANARKFPSAPCRIIGVVEGARFGDLREPAPRTIYFPVTKEAIPVYGNFVFLMSSSDHADAIAAYRKAASEIVPSIPVLRSATLQQLIDDVFGRERLITMMSNFFGGLSLLLSALGLYGLLSSSVSQRTGEIGIRLALGARRENVQWMILKDALRLVGVGIAVGAAVLFETVKFIQSMLYQVSAFDPATLAATVLLLASVGLLAAWLPAFRASRVDPTVAVRYE